MKLAKLILGTSLVLASPSAMAGASGLKFSADEIVQNRENASEISETAVACLDQYWNEHIKFFDSHGYSKFYGNRNKYLDTPAMRRYALLKILRPNLVTAAEETAIKQSMASQGRSIFDFSPVDTSKVHIGLSDFENYEARVNRGVYAEIQRLKPDLIKREAELTNISCVDLTRRCLGAGFAKAGMESTWKKIDTYVKANGVSGTDMQKALVDLGWESLYWNPDPSQNEVWDAEDLKLNPLDPTKVEPFNPNRKWMPVWGGHAENYNAVMRKGEYFQIPVSDKQTLVGFKMQPPANFEKVPFFVGTAHSGYHVFPGTMGKVIEAHSVRALSSKDNLQISDFNPIDQEHAGGPRWTDTEHYRSGVIVIPPGMLKH